MRYITQFFCLIMCVIVMSSTLSIQAGAGFPMLSSEELQELEELNKMIEEHVANNLTPEEQAQFYREVDELTRKFENMSEEEFSSFMNDMFAAEIPEAPVPEVPAPQPVQEIIELPKLTGEQKQKIETLITVIDDIIKNINIFLLHVLSSADLSARIEKWAQQGKISHWQEGADWESFKKNIESFLNQLYRAKEQDPQTGMYKYMIHFIEDEALFNNLAQLQRSLNNQVPSIETSQHGMETLSLSTKKALINTSSQLAESLYVLNLPHAFDALFIHYEPEAKKLRQAEEAAQKRALEASRQPRTPTIMAEAGIEPAEYGYEYPHYEYPEYGAPYGGYTPSYTPHYQRPYEEKPWHGEGVGGGMGTSKGGAKAEAPKEEKKEKAKEKAKGKKEKEEIEINSDVERRIATIAADLDSLNQTLTTELLLKDIARHITDAAQPYDETLVTLILPTLVYKKIIKIRDGIKATQLKICNLKDATQKHYINELKSVVIEKQAPLKDFDFAITSLHYDKKKDTITPEKRYVYFNDEEGFAQPKKKQAAPQQQQPPQQQQQQPGQPPQGQAPQEGNSGEQKQQQELEQQVEDPQNEGNDNNNQEGEEKGWVSLYWGGNEQENPEKGERPESTEGQQQEGAASGAQAPAGQAPVKKGSVPEEQLKLLKSKIEHPVDLREIKKIIDETEELIGSLDCKKVKSAAQPPKAQ